MQASSPEVGLVYCWSIEIDENDLVIPAIRSLKGGSTARGRVSEEVARGCFIKTGSSPLIKRSCIDAVGGYDASLQQGEDWKLYLALSEICEFAVVPEYLVGYRQASGSLSEIQRQANQRKMLRAGFLKGGLIFVPKSLSVKSYMTSAFGHLGWLSTVPDLVRLCTIVQRHSKPIRRDYSRGILGFLSPAFYLERPG